MSTNYAVDTALTGSRGSPNAWSPVSGPSIGTLNWTQSRGNQTLSYASNQLVLTYNGSNTTGAMTYGAISKADQEVMVNAVQGSSTSDIIGVTARFIDSSNWYSLVIGNTASTLEIRKVASGTFTTVASVAFPSTLGTKYTFKFRVTGSELKGKIWIAGSAEPTTWNVTKTDTTLTAGLFGIVGTPHSGSTTKYDTFIANDALIPLITQNTEVFQVRVMGVGQGSGTFRSRSALLSQGIETLKARGVQSTQCRGAFKVRAVQILQGREVFKSSSAQVSPSRDFYKNRAAQTTTNQPRSLIRAGLLSGYKGDFKVRGMQNIGGRSLSRTSTTQDTASRTRFITLFSGGAVHIPLHALFSITQKINSAFSLIQRTIAAFQVVQKISTTFGGSPMPQPNSTITSTATVKDSTGATLSNLSIVSVTITFPDFTTSIVGLGSGVVNAGAGTYTITYATKGPGPTREEWRVTAADGTTIADFLNWIAVGY